MAKKHDKHRERQFGKNRVVKKHLIDPRYRSTLWTIIILIVLIVFFIINNTSEAGRRGYYPPGYNPQVKVVPNTSIDKRLQMDTDIKNSNK